VGNERKVCIRSRAMGFNLGAMSRCRESRPNSSRSIAERTISIAVDANLMAEIRCLARGGSRRASLRSPMLIRLFSNPLRAVRNCEIGSAR